MYTYILLHPFIIKMTILMASWDMTSIADLLIHKFRVVSCNMNTFTNDVDSIFQNFSL